MTFVLDTSPFDVLVYGVAGYIMFRIFYEFLLRFLRGQKRCSNCDHKKRLHKRVPFPDVSCSWHNYYSRCLCKRFEY